MSELKTKIEARIATKILNIVGKAFKIEWCDNCKCLFICCPRCGMNTCSGGYGEDGKCPMCPIAYELDAKLQFYILEDNI